MMGHKIVTFYQVFYQLNLKVLISFLQMWNLRKMPQLLCLFVLIGVGVHATPVSNETGVHATPVSNETSWLNRWQTCFFENPSEDVGHFFLTRMFNCWRISGINYQIPYTTQVFAQMESLIISIKMLEMDHLPC